MQVQNVLLALFSLCVYNFNLLSCIKAWLAAATLLNLNAWASVSNASTAVQIPVAYLSGLLAFVIGGCRLPFYYSSHHDNFIRLKYYIYRVITPLPVMTIFSGDPWVALTAAWALSAVRSRTLLKSNNVSVEAEQAGRGSQVLQSLAQIEQLWVALLLVIAVGRVLGDRLGFFSLGR